MTHCQQLRPRRTRTFSTEMRPMFDYEFETVRSCCVKVAVKFERWVQVDGTKTGFSFLFSSCRRPVESGELFCSLCFIHASLGNHAEMALLSKTVESRCVAFHE